MWIGYLAVGGTEDPVSVEAYLYGLVTLDPAEQDVLALAVNERLYDLYLAARVPYLVPSAGLDSREDPMDLIINELLGPPEMGGNLGL